MKKIALTSLLAVFAVSAANAGMFDITRRPMARTFDASFGGAFTTGENAKADGETSFMTGNIRQTSLSMAYGITDRLAATLGMDNRFSNGGTELGLNYQLVNTKEFGMDLIATYGPALTKMQDGTRIDNNNINGGARVYGAMGDFQWGVKAMAQWVFAEENTLATGESDMMNVNLLGELMYYFQKDMALKYEVGYNFFNAAGDTQLYDRYMNIGAVYDMSETASVMPYVGYHFQTANSENDDKGTDNSWMFGAKFKVNF